MELDFLEIDNKTVKPKATIHITGKLGFNMEAQKLMGFSDEQTKHFLIAAEGGVDNFQGTIYFVEASEEEEKSVRVAKAGQYYYINLSSLFDRLNLQYQSRTIMFDVSKGTYKDREMFVLKKRTKETIRETTKKEIN